MLNAKSLRCNDLLVTKPIWKPQETTQTGRNHKPRTKEKIQQGYNPFMRPELIKFCPLCGTGISQQFRYGQERPVCPACDWIFFADPKVAAAMLLEHDGQVLLVRRVNEPYRGLWTLPAGFVNAGEDPAAAAARECLEETGLSVDVTGLLDIYTGREHSRGADFVIFFRGRLQGGNLNPADDADAAEWFDYSHLPPMAFRATEFILGKYQPK